MSNTQSFAIENKEQAAFLLAQKLRRFKDSQTVVVGASYGGAFIGHHLASILHLAFDVIPCTRIDHPSNSNVSIGSVSVNEVIIHEYAHDIPRDYIYRQIAMKQNTIKAQRAIYKTDSAQCSIDNKTVIIVGDVITSANDILATLRNIKNQKPEQIIIAAAAVTPDVVGRLLREADEIVALTVEANLRPATFFEEDFHIKEEAVRELIHKDMQKFEAMD